MDDLTLATDRPVYYLDAYDDGEIELRYGPMTYCTKYAESAACPEIANPRRYVNEDGMAKLHRGEPVVFTHVDQSYPELRGVCETFGA